MKPLSRDERIKAIMAEATARDRAKREAAEARRMKASGGLPLPSLRGSSSGSIALKPRRTTTGKHHAH